MAALFMSLKLCVCGCVFSGSVCEGSSSVIKLLGGRGAIEAVSSRRLVALCFLLLCLLLGLCVRGSSSVVKLLGGRVYLNLVLMLPGF